MTTEDFEYTLSHSNSLDALRVFYPDAETCYTDYARRTSQKFSSPLPSCECCGSNERVCHKVATWEMNFQNKKSSRSNLLGLLLIFVGHVQLSSAVLRFSTNHSICKKCTSRFSIGRLLTVPISFVATLASYIPVVVTVLGAFYLIFGLFQVEKAGLVAWLVVALAAVAIPFLFWVRRLSDLLTIPAFLRPIAKKPIIYRGLSSSDRG